MLSSIIVWNNCPFVAFWDAQTAVLRPDKDYCCETGGLHHGIYGAKKEDKNWRQLQAWKKQRRGQVMSYMERKTSYYNIIIYNTSNCTAWNWLRYSNFFTLVSIEQRIRNRLAKGVGKHPFYKAGRTFQTACLLLKEENFFMCLHTVSSMKVLASSVKVLHSFLDHSSSVTNLTQLVQ